MKRGLWALGIITALILLAPAAASPLTASAAKTPEGLQVRPLRSYPTQNPGTITKGSLTLTNYTDSPQQVSLTTEAFHTTNEDYRYSFGSAAATDWIQFAEPVIDLAPKESKVANYNVVVPTDAAPGGKYLAIMSTLAPDASSQKITEIRRIASLVYLQVNGLVTKISKLLSFDVPHFISKPNFRGYVRIDNGGNTHFQSRVGFYVQHWPFRGRGSYVAQLEGFVLPGTVRQLNTIIYIPRSPGLYKVTAEYSPPQGGLDRISHVVLYIPLWFVGVVGIFLVALLILVIRYWRTRRAKSTRSAVRRYKRQ